MPVSSTPYYIFGAQRKYPYAWHGGPGGVPQSTLAAESKAMGIFDLLESGLDPNSIPYATFKNTNLHRISMNHPAVGDWPVLRPSGPEPLDPNQLGIFDSLSDNEKILGAVAIAVGAWWFMRRRSRARRNPSKRPTHDVYIGNSYAMSFHGKRRAQAYADSLRAEGKRARVRKR
jgi:hypothetical protein